MAGDRPRIRLRAFGIVDLTDAEGKELGSVLARPKDIALLSYLAIATPRGFQRRDMLHALLWPELAGERARVALNKSIHYLRRALGPDIIVGHGEGDVGLAWERCWCDAAVFEAALAAGELETALDLYRGELLPGLYVSDAPEFERWIGRERARLRDSAREAAFMLTEQSEAMGDDGAAAQWARRGLRVDAYDERMLRKLVALLDRAGERAGALREFEDFARRLELELELETSPETRALADEVRARTEARTGVAPRLEPGAGRPVGEVEVPQPERERVPEPAAGGFRAAEPVPAALRRRPDALARLYWPGAGVGFLAALVVIAILGIRSADETEPTTAAESRSTVAILPFSFRGPGVAGKR